jgi:hypothetical protein
MVSPTVKSILLATRFAFHQKLICDAGRPQSESSGRVLCPLGLEGMSMYEHHPQPLLPRRLFLRRIGGLH